jgi:hypothetical protein
MTVGIVNFEASQSDVGIGNGRIGVKPVQPSVIRLPPAYKSVYL